ncbi:MAG: 6-bladed beta-propeller, partial [Gemmatimonadota bacterium]
EERARLSVGVLEGDTVEQFDQVVRPFLLPDGSLAVPVLGAHAIRIFSPDGEFVRSLGRRGEGPGEFVGLTDAWARGDTVEAFDFSLRRVTRFPPDGSAEVVNLDGALSGFISGALPDGWVAPYIYATNIDEGGRDQVAIKLFGRDGSEIDEIARIEGMRRFRNGFGGSGPHPLSPRRISRVHDGRLYLAETTTPRIDVYESDGTRVDTITWEPDPNAMSPEEAMALVVDSATVRFARGDDPYPDSDEEVEPAVTRRMYETADVPERTPAFADMRVDREGFIWIRPYEPLVHSAALQILTRATPGGTWTILSPEGERVGTVEVPSDLRPTDIASDAVVGIRRDELGVETVHVHALERR